MRNQTNSSLPMGYAAQPAENVPSEPHVSCARYSSAASTAVVSSKSKGKPLSGLTVYVRYSSDEEMIILKEVVAARAHFGKYSLVVKQFDATICAINCSTHFRTAIKTHAVQEKFNKMMKDFEVTDKQDRAPSGLGGKQSALKEMLSTIFEAMPATKKPKRRIKMKRARQKSNSWMQSGSSIRSSRPMRVTPGATERTWTVRAVALHSKAEKPIALGSISAALLSRPHGIWSINAWCKASESVAGAAETRV